MGEARSWQEQWKGDTLVNYVLGTVASLSPLYAVVITLWSV